MPRLATAEPMEVAQQRSHLQPQSTGHVREAFSDSFERTFAADDVLRGLIAGKMVVKARPG